MYIGPWQEFKLGRLIAEQTEIIKQHILQAQANGQQLHLPDLFPNSHADSVRGLVRSQSKASNHSDLSVRSAPSNAVTYGRATRTGSALSTHSTSSYGHKPKKPKQRKGKGKKKRESVSVLHQNRINQMKNLYGLEGKEGRSDDRPAAHPVPHPPPVLDALPHRGPSNGSHMHAPNLISPVHSPTATLVRLPSIHTNQPSASKQPQVRTPHALPAPCTPTALRLPGPSGSPEWGSGGPLGAGTVMGGTGTPLARPGTAGSDWEEEAEDLLAWTEQIGDVGENDGW